MKHLRYANLPDAEQKRLFLDIIWADRNVSAALCAARDLALPDGWSFPACSITPSGMR
jgi:hypothetical protein